MKKQLFSLIALCIIFAYNAEAKGVKIFDLHDQYFSGTMIKKGEEGYGKGAQYDLNHTIVFTDTKLINGSYMKGLFTVEVKEPIEDWNVHVNKKSGTGRKGESTTIRITSDKGMSYFFSYILVDSGYGTGKITINSKSFDAGKILNKKLTASASKIGNTVTFSINGQAFLKQDAKDFGKLAKVEVEANDNYGDDELLSLDIYKAK